MSFFQIHKKIDRSFVIGLVGGIVGGALASVGVLSFMLFGPFKQMPNPSQNILPNIIKLNQSPFAKNNLRPNPTQSNFNSNNNDVSSIVAKVNPAVVSIVISKDVPVMEQYYTNDPFNDFFGDQSPFRFKIPQYRQKGTENKKVGGGSGFIISSDGYIVSNAHVVNDETASYTVYLNKGDIKYPAKVIARDDVIDVALLKIDAKNLPFLEFGNSDDLKLGQSVIAIGNALGEFRNTISTGVISGLSRSITAGDGMTFAENLENLIQTDAAINPGNSGGPLINSDGKVVGVNVAVASGSENIGFALPANAVKQSIDSMKLNGKVVRPFLGVRYLPINEDLQKSNKLPVDYGVLVVRGSNQNELAVIPGSPANKAGIVEYDIILQVDGIKIDGTNSLASIIRKKKVGDSLKLKIMHNGSEKDITVILEASK